MSLEPLLNAALAIQIHVAAALVAFGVGAAQLILPKGGGRHQAMGWVWVIAMAVVAISSFWIHKIRLLGPWSPIHLLSIWTLAILPFAILAARGGRIKAHRAAMSSLFFFALVVAGVFTFLPPRIMYRIFFGA